MPRETLGNPRRERDPRPDSVIIGVTTSPRRQHYLRSLLSDTNYQVMFIKGPDPESDHPSIVEIARHKVDYVLDTENPNNKLEAFISTSSNFVIAADVRTKPLVLKPSSIGQRLVPDRDPETISLGKPHSLEAIRSNLGLMARVRKTEKQAYYEVETGTFLRGRGTRGGNGAADSSTAVLDLEYLQYLATPQGFKEYVAGYYRFYSAEAYAQSMGNVLQTEVPDITTVAGGLSIGTFLSLGAVLSINGIEKDKSEFERAVSEMLHNALFGFNKGVLKKIRPDIKKFVESYRLLQIATEIALTPRKV